VDPGFPYGVPFVDLAVPGVYAPGGAKALISKLRYGSEPVSILGYGDFSTNSFDDPFNDLIRWLGTKFPAYSANALFWDDTAGNYTPEPTYGYNSLIQYGTAGDAYATGFSASSALTTPDVAALDVSGSFQVTAKVRATDWTPATNMCISSKFGSAGQRSWRFWLDASGTLRFEISTDGTNQLTAISSVATAFADGSDGWVRVEFSASTGNTAFFTSSNGTSWNQLGTTQTIAGFPHTLFNSTQAAEIGGRGSGIEPWTGRIYQVTWRSGSNPTYPTLVLHVDFDTAIGSAAHINPSSATQTFTDCLGLVWTRNAAGVTFAGSPGIFLYNMSPSSGQLTLHAGDATKGPNSRKIFPADLVIIGYGVNEGTTSSYRTPYKAVTDALLAAWPDAAIICATASPQTAPRSSEQIMANAVRNRQVTQLATSQRFGLADTQFAFQSDYRDIADLIDSVGGTDRTAAGRVLASNVLKGLFAPWITYPRYDLVG